MNPSYLHQADLLWARCPRRARETSACSELERSCRGGSAQSRGSAEGTEAGCPRSTHAGLNPQRGLLVKDRRPKWHHAGKQDRCEMDGQRHEGFSSESNQYMCGWRGMRFLQPRPWNLTEALMSWPGVHGVRRRDEGKAALLYFSSLHLCRISKLLWCTGWCRKLKLSTLFTTGAAASCP